MRQEIDKSQWGDGPWLTEPDRKEWRDPATGLPCLAIRHPSLGNWCGYVGVSLQHPAYGKNYDSVDVQVHGGLTYADRCNGHICHTPATGESEDVWWLGFDCGQFMDVSPGTRAYIRESRKYNPFADALLEASEPREVYRTLAYVESECADLAKQLAAMQT